MGHVGRERVARDRAGTVVIERQPHLFGERAPAFADEVRALLASTSATGAFWDWPGDTEIVFARRPA